jgi:uncharacterized paraquat-inducible protein A
VNPDAWDEDEEDVGEDDEETTIPCPYCKRSIHEESPRCPHCGNYISQEDTAQTRKPWWIIVGVVLVFYAIYRWIVG